MSRQVRPISASSISDSAAVHESTQQFPTRESTYMSQASYTGNSLVMESPSSLRSAFSQDQERVIGGMLERLNTTSTAVNKLSQLIEEEGKTPINGVNSSGQSAFPSNSAEGWTLLDRKFRELDEDTIQNQKDDIDTLLVFAGLFSGVLTAFNVQSYQMLQPNAVDNQTCLLSRISQQLASASISSGIAGTTAPGDDCFPPFQPSTKAVTINMLWFLSLVFSLITASLGMLVKQWLREYMSLESISPQRRCRVRIFRHHGLRKWRVLQIAAVLPLLLQIALGLFFLGLSEFLGTLHPVIEWVVAAVILLWLALLFTTAICPLFWSDCPYRIPLFKLFVQLVWQYFPEMKLRLSHTYVRGFSEQPSIRERLTFRVLRLLDKLPRPIIRFPESPRSIRETCIRDDGTMDLQALLDGDATFQDDQYLESIFQWCVVEACTSSPNTALSAIRTVIGRRDEAFISDYYSWPRGLRSCQKAIMEVFMHVLGDGFHYQHMWDACADDAFSCLCGYLQDSSNYANDAQTAAKFADFVSSALVKGNNIHSFLRNKFFRSYVKNLDAIALLEPCSPWTANNIVLATRRLIEEQAFNARTLVLPALRLVCHQNSRPDGQSAPHDPKTESASEPPSWHDAAAKLFSILGSELENLPRRQMRHFDDAKEILEMYNLELAHHLHIDKALLEALDRTAREQVRPKRRRHALGSREQDVVLEVAIGTSRAE